MDDLELRALRTSEEVTLNALIARNKYANEVLAKVKLDTAVITEVNTHIAVGYPAYWGDGRCEFKMSVLPGNKPTLVMAQLFAKLDEANVEVLSAALTPLENKVSGTKGPYIRVLFSTIQGTAPTYDFRVPEKK